MPSEQHPEVASPLSSAFPRTRAAISAIAASDRQNSRTERLYKAAVKAYASEMLPWIIGEEWAHSRTWLGRLMPTGYNLALFDHSELFRMRYRRGPSTWQNTLVIGQPYCDVGNAEQVEAAEDLNRAGVVVWVRPDLSAWFPGSTGLVLASSLLKWRDAADFGFQCLANPCPEAVIKPALRLRRWA